MNGEIEIEFEDAKKGVKFKLKGSSEIVEAYLEKYGYASAMKDAVNRQEETAAIVTVQTNTKETPVTTEIPEKPNANTISGYISSMMCSSWGTTGRTSTELIEVARAHGVALSQSTISGILHRLANIGKLRRQRDSVGGQWKYYPPTSFVMKRE